MALYRRSLRRNKWNPSEIAIEIAEKIEELIPGAEGHKEVTICDIGGAHGRDCLYLSERGFNTILSEPNKHSLEYAKNHMREEGIYFNLISGALPYLPIESESIDVVESRGVLHHIPYECQAKALQEINRVMKPNGILYCSSYGYFRENLPEEGMYPIERLKEFMKLHKEAGFGTLRISGYRPKSANTNPHRIMWCGKFQRLT